MPATTGDRRRVWFAGGGTGGHLYPGLAIARALVRLDPAIEPFFIGARRGIERTVLPTQGFAFELLDLHPLYRRRPWENWKTVRGAVLAWRRLTALAGERPPVAVVGTGGYAMGLAVAWAGRRGVPVVQQVADVVPGLTARWAARWSRELYLGFPEAAPHFRGKATFVTGNPIEPPPAARESAADARRRFGLTTELGRIVLVFGGSQGARAINEAVAGWVRSGLPAGVGLIWATGAGQEAQYRDLASDGRIVVTPYLSPISHAYAAADLAITRAGAITCAELSAWGLPAIMIPLPTAAADHQTTNARALEDAGSAICFPQQTLTSRALADTVDKLLAGEERLKAMRIAALRRARPDSALEIAERVRTLIAN
ncbi:MAG: UDP-N-acetylglucosamine--N-acetylmuramyl-(pentapeptide) pyrophosphoryl-undecaprenol N-acetylglucosamine transferase [Gemmatimonadota bacterium]|jgi:UDP-N-acetylglucosamine--N-acetylmuramyl-(pentapeptide) pyrophosphoryl-undecaprenol N-acetylglucosamine transferase